MKIDSHINNANYHQYVLDGIKTGKWMKANFDKSAILATNTCGSIAFYSQLKIIDMMGINDPFIAQRQNLPKEWKGIEKGDGRYVLSRKPDYIQFGSSTGSVEPVYLSDIEIYQSDDFWKYYDLEKHVVDDQTTLLIYKRRSIGRSHFPSHAAKLRIEEIAADRMRNSSFRY